MSHTEQRAPASRESRPIRLCHVFTVPESLLFIRGQTRYMQERGLEIHVITSPGAGLERFGQEEHVHTYAVDMPRRITVLQDARALWRIVRIIRRVCPEIVHSHTPKGGLLGMIAASLLRVPVRIYHIRGLPYMTATGPRRVLLKATERISCRLADEVICVSHMIREVAIEDGVCPAGKIRTFHGGSGNGVDATVKFDPGRFDAGRRRALRRELGYGEDDVVIGFVGRIFREKGVAELAGAWRELRDACPQARLVLVGAEQSRDPIPAATLAQLRDDPRVRFTGVVADMPAMYAVFDLLVLPTYREGLPNVLLEAAAMGLPVVSTAIPGCIDVVQDGVTGTLVPPRDVARLRAAIVRYLEDPALRRRNGAAGRARVLAEFGQEAIWASIWQEYETLLRQRGIVRAGRTALGQCHGR